MGEIEVPCPFAPRARGDRRFQGILFLVFLLTPHLRFGKRAFGSGFCLGLGKANIHHEWPEMSSPRSRLREGYGGPREIREGQNNERKIKLMKTHLKIFTPILSVLACFAFLPQMQAVVPAPDGCYPGFTTAEGCRALESLTTGTGNTGLGFWALILDTTGLNNTGVGAQSLAMNNGDLNTAVGVVSLVFNLGGSENTAIGAQTLPFNDGDANGAFGAFALFNNTDGFANNAFGEFALLSNDHGSGNSAFGHSALSSNVNANGNTAVGIAALSSNDFFGTANAIHNTAVGSLSLFENLESFNNTAVGSEALLNNDFFGNGVANNN